MAIDQFWSEWGLNRLVNPNNSRVISFNVEAKAQLAQISHHPGCYLFLNDRQQVLYVGKAKNLQKRVSSYFQKSQNQRTATLISETSQIQTFVCDSEKEALILEYNLVKNHHPKFNVLLKDDKRFPYIVIVNARHPYYLYTRKPVKNALFYYGPLPDGSKARQLLQMLQEIIPLRRCSGSHRKPCFYFQLGRCSGACFRTVSSQWYGRQIKKVQAFFTHQDATIERTLTSRMMTAAKQLQFEQANKIKLLIQRLDWVRSEQQAQLKTTLNADFISYHTSDQRVIFVVLFYRQGCLIHQHHAIFTTARDINWLTRMFLLQLYEANPLPEIIIVNQQLAVRDLQIIWPDRVRHPGSNIETKILQLAHRNAQNLLTAPENLNPTINWQPQLEQLQKLCAVQYDLYRIEMFDVSSWSDQIVVGSCAVFKNGQLSRRENRCYQTTVNGNNDYQALAEIIAKHYQSSDRIKKAPPDLVIVDGGWAHVRVAQRTLTHLKLNFLVIGLSKNDHHQTENLVTSTGQIIKLKVYPSLWQWLTYLQTTTHNIGVNYFHRRKLKGLKTNLLLQVKGISSQKAQQLYGQFHDLPTMAKSSFEQLNQIINNQTTTRRLINFFHDYDRWHRTNLAFD